MSTTLRASAESLSTLRSIALASFILACLFLGQALLIPLAFAGLLAFMLNPLVNFLERSLGRALGVALAAVVLVGVLVSVAWVLSVQVSALFAQLPTYGQAVQLKLRSLQLPAGGWWAHVGHVVQAMVGGAGGAAPGALAAPVRGAVPMVSGAESFDMLSRIGGSSVSWLADLGLVLLLTLFMLADSDELQSRLIRLIGADHIGPTQRALLDASKRIRRYLLMQIIVNSGFGVVIAIGLGVIGIPQPALWGLIAAVLRFVPYVGAWIAAFVPALLGLALGATWHTPLLVLGLFAATELVTGNALEPWLYGSSTGVSAFALILAAIFWTSLWGPAGLVVSTPLTVLLLVVARHVPGLAFFAVLLGEESVLKPPEALYRQLMRAGANAEAIDIAETVLRDRGWSRLFDDLLMPTLRSIERDAARDSGDEAHQMRLRAAFAAVVEQLANEPLEDSPGVEALCRIVCIPARVSRPDAACGLAADFLRGLRYDARAIDGRDALQATMIEIGTGAVDRVLICLQGPSDLRHAQRLIERIRVVREDQPVLVMRWNDDEMNQPLGAGVVEVRSMVALATACNGRDSRGSERQAPPGTDCANRARLGMDLEPHPALDALIASLRDRLDSAGAMLSLFDDDQQLLKSVAFRKSTSALPTRLPRAQGVCGQVIARGSPVVIEDLTRDRRFAGNALLDTWGIRSYAGMPIDLGTGMALAVVCVFDSKPRTFTSQERSVLREVARQVGDILLAGCREPLVDAVPLVSG